MNNPPQSVMIAIIIAMCVFVVGAYILAKNERLIKEKGLEDKLGFLLIAVVGVTLVVVNSIANIFYK